MRQYKHLSPKSTDVARFLPLGRCITLMDGMFVIYHSICTTDDRRLVVYTLKDIPGKGRGLVAARALSRGELILAEPPLLVQPPSYTNATILRALSTLSAAQQRDYFNLANAHKGVHPPPLGVFKTNALPCGDHDITTGTAAGSGAVFVLGSRFNSSCDPNVNNYWDDGQKKITFWAVRDTAEGEELLISYGEHFAGRDARRARLKMQFGFVCECTACSRTGEDLKASDERRVTIGNLYNEIGQYGAVPAVGIRKVSVPSSCLLWTIHHART